MMLMKRQGDVLFIFKGVDAKVPADFRKRNSGVIAEGELTGHSHHVKGWTPDCGVTVLDAPAGTEVPMGAEAPDMYLTAETDVEVGHQEHGTIELEPGVWQVRRQRQYEPEGNRQVRD
jgi:hypothetical protein